MTEAHLSPQQQSALSSLTPVPQKGEPESEMIPVGRPGRALYLYDTNAGYDLQDELDFLSNRSIEPNVFFAGNFLAPALPRLEDRHVRLAILRDTDGRNRARILLPFSIEKPGFALGTPIVRAWANSFAPLGTPLVDREDAAESIDNLFEAMARPAAKLPQVLVLPDVRLNGPATRLFKVIAMTRNLPTIFAGTTERPMLESRLDGEAYLRQSLSNKHRHDLQRLWRKLAAVGELTYNVARQPKEIHQRMEEFLLLEAAGWKGREKSALANDRYRAAFAREAVHNLASVDKVRIHTLDLDGKAIASLIVFIASGEAFTWKTAYDERYSTYSPGKLLVARLTEWNLDDANILRSDSCAVADHPVMSYLWKERETLGTLIIGLQPNSDREIRQVSTQLHLYQNTRNIAKRLRNRIMAMRRG